MKTKWHLVVGLAVLVAACETRSSVTRGDGVVLTGYLAFQGEFQLFPNREDVGVFPGKCTSLTFEHRELLNRARHHVGERVSIEGKMVDWPPDVVSLQFGENHLLNYCGKGQVMFARSID